MAKTYFPNDKHIAFIDASHPHPKHTQYKISIGLEQWNNENHEVVKIQMVYENKISGRKSPSYPIGTDDFQRVMLKVNELLINKKID